jgi:hypothetical protein
LPHGTFVSELPLSYLLLVVARKGVLDGGGSIAEAILSLLEDAFALLGSVIGARAGGVADLLAGRLLALCDEESVCVEQRSGLGVLTRLDSAGNAVTSTGHVLANLVGGGLLGVRGDWTIGQCLAISHRGVSGAHSSQTPARRDPCGGCQTC